MHTWLIVTGCFVFSAAGFIGSETAMVPGDLQAPEPVLVTEIVACAASDPIARETTERSQPAAAECVPCPETFFTTDCRFTSQIVCRDTDLGAPCCTENGEVAFECQDGETVKNIRCRPSRQPEFCVSGLLCG